MISGYKSGDSKLPRTDVSYEKNLIADSGKIFATDSPFPTQNPRIPPSLYILFIALLIALTPLGFGVVCVLTLVTSGARVIRKTFSRSNGAVVVRETGK